MIPSVKGVRKWHGMKPLHYIWKIRLLPSDFSFSFLPNCECLKVNIVTSLLPLPHRLKKRFRDPSTVGWISILPSWWRTLSAVFNGLEYWNCLFTCHLFPCPALYNVAFTEKCMIFNFHVLYLSLLSFLEHNVPCSLILSALSSFSLSGLFWVPLLSCFHEAHVKVQFSYFLLCQLSSFLLLSVRHTMSWTGTRRFSSSLVVSGWIFLCAVVIWPFCFPSAHFVLFCCFRMGYNKGVWTLRTQPWPRNPDSIHSLQCLQINIPLQ